jgi:hypothetical protein
LWVHGDQNRFLTSCQVYSPFKLEPVLFEVFSWLSAAERATTARVCKSFYAATQDSRLLPRHLSLPGYLSSQSRDTARMHSVYPSVIPRLLRQVSPFLTKLAISSPLPIHLLGIFSILPFPRLSRVDVRHWEVDNLLRALSHLLVDRSVWPSLSYLSIGRQYIERWMPEARRLFPSAPDAFAYTLDKLLGSQRRVEIDVQVCKRCQQATLGKRDAGPWPRCCDCDLEWCNTRQCPPGGPFWICSASGLCPRYGLFVPYSSLPRYPALQNAAVLRERHAFLGREQLQD